MTGTSSPEHQAQHTDAPTDRAENVSATVIINEKAGNGGGASLQELEEALLEVGYEPVIKATSTVEELDTILDGITGLVVSAGGDGTARAIATRLIGEKAAFVPLPMGTANNLSRSLGIDGTPLEIIARLHRPRRRRLDLGYLQGPWGEDYFIEGAGMGFFAEALAKYDPEKGKSILRGVGSIAEIVSGGFSHETTIRVDGGATIKGCFLIIEALNIPAVGPRLKFAPEADPTDGLLHVVLVRRSDREGFLQYVTSMVAEDLEQLESVEVVRAKRVEIAWTGFPFHVDGEVRPRTDKSQRRVGARAEQPDDRGPSGSTVVMEVVPQALELWLPQPESDEENE